jgi:hypothetical protein
MHARRLLQGLALSCLAALAGACKVPGTQPLSPERSGPQAGSDLPPWAGQPPSSEKLDAISAWLATPESGRSRFWRLEGELQLAEGRASLATGVGLDETRRTATRAAFRRVHDDPAATAGQQQRAAAGLAGLGHPVEAHTSQIAGVVTREQWRARPALVSNLTPHRGAWNYITVHHSAMDGGVRLDGSLATAVSAVQRIQSAQMASSGFGDVGYHFLIDDRGRIFQGRELRWQGAHAGGNNNVGNVGVCVIGNFDEARPTSAALGALERLVATLERELRIPPGRVKAHLDWKGTVCPGKNLLPYVRRLQ